MVASVADPTIFLPAGALVKGSRVGLAAARSALNTGVAAGVGTAVQEVGLHGSQELRTPTESGLAIGGSVILGGLIGGAAGAYTAKEWAAATKVMNDVIDAENAAAAALPQSAGAAATPRATLDDLSIAGGAASKVAKATAQLNPVLRLNQSPSVTVREIAGQLMENPMYLKKNLEGAGDTAAETATHEWTRGAVVKALEAPARGCIRQRSQGRAGDDA